MTESLHLGVDGCRGGWVAACLPLRGRARFELHPDFPSLLAAHPAAASIAVDMPIGLLDEREPGGRLCDRLARARLGRPRSSSVFSPPLRRHLRAKTYGDVRADGLTIQAFNILPRIREVDEALDAALQQRVIEAHPELAWAALAGEAVAAPKRSPEGREARRSLLAGNGAAGPRLLAALDAAEHPWPRKLVQPDDVLDAAVLALVARRHARGAAERLPEDPPRDARGLRMEIWF